MKDKKVKFEEIEVSHTLQVEGEGRVQGKGRGNYFLFTVNNR